MQRAEYVPFRMFLHYKIGSGWNPSGVFSVNFANNPCVNIIGHSYSWSLRCECKAQLSSGDPSSVSSNPEVAGTSSCDSAED